MARRCDRCGTSALDAVTLASAGMVSRQDWISAERLSDRYVVTSARGRTTTNVSSALVANAAMGRAVVLRRATRAPSRSLSRAHVSMAAKVRMGAGSIEYWKWNDQKLGDADQNRSRKVGRATSRSGEASGSSANAAKEPTQTLTFSAGVNSSCRLASGWRTMNETALSGPLPSASYVQCRYDTPPPRAGMTTPRSNPNHAAFRAIRIPPRTHRRCTARM